ncbi:cupredoxin domain-containing protein [Halorussus salinisoli]|uniref:cupredoxin domain-containing protein n=1 Tax=Halorussus salinisoli TaxID=2558242 RepID=UPI0010C1E7B5|nr:plastocyanin [Halorussus salinisoli]
MPAPDAETTDESTSKSFTERLGVERRPLLKALGVGASIPFVSGVTVASGEESDAQDSAEAAQEIEPMIDPVFGHPMKEAENVPDILGPDHEVELHRDFPEDIQNPDHPSFFHFEPTGLRVDSGDIVQFTFTSPNHTITAYHPGHGFQRRVPEEVPAFSSPLVQKDGAWLYQFMHEGLYDLYCGVHSVLGMVMRIVVGDFSEEDVPDYADTFEAEPPLFAPVSEQFLEHELEATSEQNENVDWTWLTAPQVLKTDALDPMRIQEAGTVSFETVADELGVAFDPEDGE